MIKYLNRDTLTLFLCLILSLLLYFSSTSPIVSSVKAELSDFVSVVTYPQTYYSDLMLIQEQNLILKKKLVQMNMLNSELIKYEHENSELKKLLDFYNVQPWSLKVAKVVNDNYSYLMRTITINLGLVDGISKNLPVVDVNGLVGKVEVASDRASNVQLITDKNFIVSVRLGSEMSIGEFKATHKKLGIVYGVRKTANIKIGDIVYTSGVSTIYPDSVPVAKVVKINKENDNPFQDIEVEILADLVNFNHVFVVL